MGGILPKPTFTVNIPAGAGADLRTFQAYGDGWILAFAQEEGAIASCTIGGSVIPNMMPGWISVQDDDRTITNGGLNPATVTFWLMEKK